MTSSMNRTPRPVGGSGKEAPVAVVTGAGSGIGRATAIALSARGYRLALVGRRLDKLEHTATLVETECLQIAADVGSPRDAAEIVDAAVHRFGRIDALINNAGMAPLVPIEQTTADMVEEVMRVNALGPAYTTLSAWKHFVKQNGGCVVYLSSLASLDPFPGFFAYSAAKAAVNLMAKSAAKEGREKNIRAFAVAPGAVETDMLRSIFPESAIPRERCLTPDDVAHVIVECVIGRRDDRSGETIIVSSPGA